MLEQIELKPNWERNQVAFLDFIVNGTSLHDQFDHPQVRDLCTVFLSNQYEFDGKSSAAIHASWFLGYGETPFPDDRIPLYICSCGDFDCGTVTAYLTVNDGTIQWSEFRFERLTEELQDKPLELTSVKQCVFERNAYEKLFQPFLRKVID